MRRTGLVVFTALCGVALSASPALAAATLVFSPVPAVAGGTITFTATCDAGTTGGRVFLGTMAGPLANQTYTFTGASDSRTFTIPAGTTPGKYPTSLTCSPSGGLDTQFSIAAAPAAVPVVDYRVAGVAALILLGTAAGYRRFIKS